MIDEIYNNLKGQEAFNVYRYQEGLQPNDLVVTLKQYNTCVFQIKAHNELNNDEKISYTVQYGLQIPNTPNEKIQFPELLKKCYLAFKKYEENLIKFQGNLELVLGQILIEPHQLFRLKVLDSDFYNSSLYEPLPRSGISKSVSANYSHQAFSIPPGMPNRVLVYRMQASSVLDVLNTMYILPQTIQHKMIDCPILPAEVEAKLCKYAAHTGGTKKKYQAMDNPDFGKLGQITYDGNTVIFDALGINIENPQQKNKSNITESTTNNQNKNTTSSVINLPAHEQEDVIDLYQISKQQYNIGEFNDPKRAIMILDRYLQGCPEKMYFLRPQSKVFDDQQSDEEQKDNYEDQMDKSIDSFHFDKINTIEHQQNVSQRVVSNSYNFSSKLQINEGTNQNKAAKQDGSKKTSQVKIQNQQAKQGQKEVKSQQSSLDKKYTPPKAIGATRPQIHFPRPFRPMNYQYHHQHHNQQLMPEVFPLGQLEYSRFPNNIRSRQIGQSQKPIDQFQHPQPFFGVHQRQQQPGIPQSNPASMLMPHHFPQPPPPPYMPNPHFLNPYTPINQNQLMYFGYPNHASMISYNDIKNNGSQQVKYRTPQVYKRIPKKCQVKSLLASVNDSITLVLSDQFKFQFFRHQNIYQADNTIRSVKIRFTV